MEVWIKLVFTLLSSHHELGRNSWFVLQTGGSLGLLCGSLLLLQLGVQDQLLQRSGELPDVPPHDSAVSAGSEKLWKCLALYPHGLVHGLDVRDGQADLPLWLASLPVVPPANLAIVAATSQQVAVLGVELAGDEVVGWVELQQRLGGVLWQ